MSTYAIIGGTLWGNRGAEAMVATTIGRIRDREPDASFLLLSYFPERDSQLLDDPAIQVIDARPKQTVIHAWFALAARMYRLIGVRVPDPLLPRSVRALRGCRALFDVSGISFHDGRLAVVAYNVMCLWPAMLLGVPVIRLSQAMGPFRRLLNRLPSRWMTKRAFHTFARGQLTAEYVRGLGVPDDSWSVAADVAFAYRPTDSLTSENDDRVAELSDRLAEIREAGSDIVALVPSSLVMQKMSGEGGDYVGLLHDLVRELHARGRHVLVMPNATRAGEEGLRNNDIAVVTALRARIDAHPDGSLDQAAVSYVDFDVNTASIRSLAAPCTLVITSRFHAMVAALALGVPTLVMGWSHKYEEVLAMFGSAADAVDFTSAQDDLMPMVDRLLAEVEPTRERILKALPAVTASSEAQFDLLDRLPDRS